MLLVLLSHAWSLHLLKQVDLPSLFPWKQESLCEHMRPGVRIWRRGIPTSSPYSAQRYSAQPCLLGMGVVPTLEPWAVEYPAQSQVKEATECAGLQRNTALAGMLCATHGLWVRHHGEEDTLNSRLRGSQTRARSTTELAPGGVCLGREGRQDSSQLPTWLCGQRPEYVRGGSKGSRAVRALLWISAPHFWS